VCFGASIFYYFNFFPYNILPLLPLLYSVYEYQNSNFVFFITNLIIDIFSFMMSSNILIINKHKRHHIR
jgi:hypothetical protein